MEAKTNWYTKTESNQPIIADEETGDTIAVIYNQKDGSEKQIANLIASAPELLEALTDVLRILNLEPTYDNLYQRNKIEALINKAKGNTSC
jgi:hypothetical protein